MDIIYSLSIYLELVRDSFYRDVASLRVEEFALVAVCTLLAVWAGLGRARGRAHGRGGGHPEEGVQGGAAPAQGVVRGHEPAEHSA